MMKNRLRAILKRAILVVAPFFLIACEKSTGEIGLGQVIDSKAVLGTQLNMPIQAYTIRFDSVQSSRPSQEVVGNYMDPVFGNAKGQTNTHVLLSLLSPDFGDDPICDSVVMSLGYNGYYADTSQAVTFVVSELGEYLPPDSTYYSNYNFQLGQELGRITTIPRPRTLGMENGQLTSPALKLNLDKDYFQEKLINASRIAQEYFINNEEFIKHMYGIQLSAENTTNGMTYFNISNLSSVIRVYYRESSTDTIVRNYELFYGIFNSGNFVSINTFQQDFSTAQFNLENQDTVNGEPTVYTQAMGGAAVQIELPDLKTLRDSGFVINRAELIAPVRSGSVGKYTLPEAILLLENQGDGSVFVDDYRPGGLGAGGNLEIGRLRDNKYVFNVTRMVHRYIYSEDPVFPLIMVPTAAASVAWRAVINGNTDPVDPMRFNIYYTKTKN